MRHGFGYRKLNKTSEHRKALFKNMLNSLIKYEQIITTLPKAKELRGFVEPLITLAKNDSVSNRRLAFSKIRNKDAVGKLFSDIGPRYKERPGGYLRIIKMSSRVGDSAPMAYVELVDKKLEDKSEESS